MVKMKHTLGILQAVFIIMVELLYSVVVGDPVDVSVTFINVPELGGGACPYEYTTMPSLPARSKLECITRCKLTPECLGVFYSHVTSTCSGCGKVCDAETYPELPRLQGSVYYKLDTYIDGGHVFIYSVASARAKVTGTKQTYSQGKVLCEDLGGFPMHPWNFKTNNIVQSALSENSIGSAYIGYLANTSAEASQTWNWDTKTTDNTFTDWAGDEPNRHQVKVTNKYCAIMHVDNSYEWSSVNCNSLHRIICQGISSGFQFG